MQCSIKLMYNMYYVINVIQCNFNNLCNPKDTLITYN